MITVLQWGWALARSPKSSNSICNFRPKIYYFVSASIAIFAQKYIILSRHRLQFSPKNIWFCLCINSRSANARPSDCPSNDQQCHTSSTLRCVCVFHINIHINIYCATVCLLDVLKMLHKVSLKKKSIVFSYFWDLITTCKYPNFTDTRKPPNSTQNTSIFL